MENYWVLCQIGIDEWNCLVNSWALVSNTAFMATKIRFTREVELEQGCSQNGFYIFELNIIFPNLGDWTQISGFYWSWCYSRYYSLYSQNGNAELQHLGARTPVHLHVHHKRVGLPLNKVLCTWKCRLHTWILELLNKATGTCWLHGVHIYDSLQA